ncbi:hypothetical protein [Paramixta manurensis]|uniref:hypothetical protein n=1 Tax=Paramixta manurensis TaxID=2740817 RepID=UPI00156B5E1C
MDMLTSSTSNAWLRGVDSYTPPLDETSLQPQDKSSLPTNGAVSYLQSPNNAINFGNTSAHPPVNNLAKSAPNNGGDDLGQLLRELISQIMMALSKFMQGNQPSNDSASGGDNSASSPPPVSSRPAVPQDNSVTPPQNEKPQAVSPPPTQSTPPLSSDGTQKPSGQSSTPAAAGDGPNAGSGPRTFNITNQEDHPIKVGQFDKDNKLVAEMTLQPGQSGQMHYQNDFTGLLKQSDADGKYKDDASRLEFFDGYVNTSDIDGRNAAIYATDHKGFEIGDTKSIADSAPDDIVSRDSAGNKTIAGFYDGSTDKMKEGGEFMTDQLGTGMTYMHPDDDKLPQGQNPMRHTDSMTLDVTFDDA